MRKDKKYFILIRINDMFCSFLIWINDMFYSFLIRIKCKINQIFFIKSTILSHAKPSPYGFTA